MPITDKLTMISMVVSDMPKAKEFYADKLGLKVTNDYRQDDNNWWVTLDAPNGGATLTLARYHKNLNPPGSGTLSLYFATPNVTEAHKELTHKGVKANDIKDDLYGPGSGVKWFNLEDPDGNLVHLVQA